MIKANVEETKKPNGEAAKFNSSPLNSQNLESEATKAVENMKSKVSDFATSAKESYKTNRQYVIDNPGIGMAVAATTGMVVGSLLTMMMRGRK